MAKQVFVNNFTSTLAAGINNSVTSISLGGAEYTRLKDLASAQGFATGDTLYLTLEGSGNIEIVRVTEFVDAGSLLTVVRGQADGEFAFAVGAVVEHRVCLNTFSALLADAIAQNTQAIGTNSIGATLTIGPAHLGYLNFITAADLINVFLPTGFESGLPFQAFYIDFFLTGTGSANFLAAFDFSTPESPVPGILLSPGGNSTITTRYGRVRAYRLASDTWLLDPNITLS